jgi:hypothetical protein
MTIRTLLAGVALATLLSVAGCKCCNSVCNRPYEPITPCNSCGNQPPVVTPGAPTVVPPGGGGPAYYPPGSAPFGASGRKV